jgi:hypothetical protein
VFEWSKGEKCRFYVIIRDGTGPASKQRYKELRKLVEDRFYPLHRPFLSATSRSGQQPPHQQTSGLKYGTSNVRRTYDATEEVGSISRSSDLRTTLMDGYC